MTETINLTELDFLKLKQNLVDYLSNQDTLSDINFNGSNMSVLIGALSYVDLLNSHKAHIVLNETSLQTAQKRSNIVSRAKNFGYVPLSVVASKALINIVVTPSQTELLTAPQNIYLPKGTNFKGFKNNKTYNFVTNSDYFATLQNDKYIFENITLYQGKNKIVRFRVDAKIVDQKFVIPDQDIDTSTLSVYVKDNERSSLRTAFKKYFSFSNLDDSSRVYYLGENYKEFYEVNFGDGNIGKKLLTNNIVELEYIYTDNIEGDDVYSFSIETNISGFTNIALETVQYSKGGSLRQDAESIRRNAYPLYSAQNRAVTAEDYRALISSNMGNIQTINVWGGSENVPKKPGNVIICIKPKNDEYLSDTDIAFIKENILKNKTALEINQIFLRPDYTYIRIENYFKYDPLITNKSKTTLEKIVKENIISYNDNNLEKFDGVFRNSNVLRIVENSDVSIVSAFNKVYMLKYFDTILTDNFSIKLSFPTPIFRMKEDFKILKSDILYIGGESYFLEDVYVKSEIKRKISLFKVASPNPVLVKDDVGYIDFDTNEISLYNFKTDEIQKIKLTVIPESDDIIPKRNQLLTIREEEIFTLGDIDTISTQGSSGIVGYNIISRTKGF